jgi:hypothetical protein
MCLKIQCDGKSEKFCKIFCKLNQPINWWRRRASGSGVKRRVVTLKNALLLHRRCLMPINKGSQNRRLQHQHHPSRPPSSRKKRLLRSSLSPSAVRRPRRHGSGLGSSLPLRPGLLQQGCRHRQDPAEDQVRSVLGRFLLTPPPRVSVSFTVPSVPQFLPVL